MSDASDRPADALATALVELWLLPTPGPDNLFSVPSFVRLKALLQTLYPEAGHPVFAFGNALRNLGLPCGLPAERLSTKTRSLLRIHASGLEHTARAARSPNMSSIGWT